MIIEHYPRVPEEDFEALVISYEDGLAVRKVYGDNCLNLVFSWPADTNNKEAMARLESRRLAIEKTRKDRLAGNQQMHQVTI